MKSQFSINAPISAISVILLLSATIINSLEFSSGPGDTLLVRNVRDVIGKTTDGKENVSTLNLAEHFDDDYPVIFNILLWMGIALAIATLAISVFIGTMDPGRDSLIYRVTSAQRFKKDN